MWQRCKHCNEVSEDWGTTIYEGYPAEYCYECGGVDCMEYCDEPEEVGD